MFDLDGHIVGNVRKFLVKLVNQFHGVADSVEKIRVAEGNVLRAGRHLPPHVFHHNAARDDAKHALINRNDRTMAAQMFAAAARFGGTHDAVAAIGQNKMRVLSIAGRPVRSGTRNARRSMEVTLDSRATPFASPAQAASSASNSPPINFSTPSERKYSAFIGA